MKIVLITAFPPMVEVSLGESMMGRAAANEAVEFHVVDLRDYGEGKHRQIDDTPYGGGPGMILKAPPILTAVTASLDLFSEEPRIVIPSPQGEPFTQGKALELSEASGLMFVCGHYTGIDRRVSERLAAEEISIGDYVLTCGELPALVIIDAIVRLLPCVLHDSKAAEEDSFMEPLLGAPNYTRPEVVEGLRVPDVLLSGDHEAIAAWRMEQRIARTEDRRPDLLRSGSSA